MGSDGGRRMTERMLAAMVHRGPDQDGLWQSNGAATVTFGHRRLSILDLSEAGRQPMVDPASGVCLTYNGECYNFVELRSELKDDHEFRSSSDTEVVLAAYLRWGEEAISRLRGMYALAIWDPRDETVLLVRDRLGIKPLYYAAVDGAVFFASEVRALLASEKLERKLDARAVHSYVWNGFVVGSQTVVGSIMLLEAGTTLRFDYRGRKIAAKRYWNLAARHAVTTAEDGSQVARKALQNAIHQHLRSDVPLGVFLSGGIDSSLVAAMAAETSSNPVITFNLRFEEAKYDESRYARYVADHLKTEHREVTLTEAMFDAQLDDALECVDQPTFDAINTYFVSRAVREAGLTVALAGTGGDELFGGYSSFVDIPRAQRVARLMRPVPQRLSSAMARAVRRLAAGRPGEVPPQTRWGKLADVLATRGDLLGLYQTSYGLFSRQFLAELQLRPPSKTQWGLAEREAEELRALIAGQPNLHAISILELSCFLRERLLRDTDAASMAVSLEVRVPLLDHEFVEAALALPTATRFEPVRKKLFLRQLIGEQLDPSIFDREKAGFELPLDIWCRRRLSARLNQVFGDINLIHACGLNAEATSRLWRAYKAGAPGIYWSRIWGLFVFLTWCRRHRVFAC